MFHGFGLDVPFTKFGTTQGVGNVVANNSGSCGNSFAVQQMLTDLGFPVGTIDGAIGNKTFAALKAFSIATGVPYTPGAMPQSGTCQGLMDAWSANMAPPPQAAAQAPSGGTMKLNLSPLISIAKGMNTASSTSAASTSQTPSESGTGWWASQGTPTKVAIVGGAVLLVGGIAYLTLGGSKKATPNRTRTRRARANWTAMELHDAYEHIHGILRSERARLGRRFGKVYPLGMTDSEVLDTYERQMQALGAKKATPNRRSSYDVRVVKVAPGHYQVHEYLRGHHEGGADFIGSTAHTRAKSLVKRLRSEHAARRRS